MVGVWCCISALTSMILSVCCACENSTGLPSARLNHKHLSCLALELLAVSVLNRTHLPFATSISTTSSSHCTPLEHDNLDLLDVGHCLDTTSCRASPRLELRLRYLVSFRDVRHLSLSHNVCYINSLRDLLFPSCWFISLNCTCVVSTAFWIFPGARHLAVTLSAAQ